MDPGFRRDDKKERSRRKIRPRFAGCGVEKLT
jgi:hypothetical protein